jgi:hypothetical protein
MHDSVFTVRSCRLRNFVDATKAFRLWPLYMATDKGVTQAANRRRSV